MSRLGWGAAAVLAARGISATVDAADAFAWLRHGNRIRTADQAAGTTRFVLVVPLLREQDLVRDVLSRMAALAQTWPDTSVVLATTEAENVQRAAAAGRLPALARRLASGASPGEIADDFGGVLPVPTLRRLARETRGKGLADCLAAAEAALARTPTTPQLVAAATAELHAEVKVRCLHDLSTEPGIARQVNYAIRAEISRARTEGVAVDQLFFGIYNADSAPHPETLRVAAASIAEQRRTGTTACILQQSATFTANLDGLPPGAVRNLLAGAGWLQSRWTLAREVPRLRRQARQASAARPVRWPKLAHCVGHGLFVRADVYERLGGLPESTLNEDLAFGYLACAAGVPIQPLPVLEEADTPESLRSWVDQGRRWFRSYAQYPKAASLAATLGFGDARSRGWLTVQGWVRGCLWLGQSPVLAAALALPFHSRRKWDATALLAVGVTTYYLLPAALVARLVNRPFRLQAVPGGVAAALVSSFGPWWSLAETVWHACTGTVATRGKTER